MHISEITREKYKELIALSVTNYGNVSRINKAIDKAHTDKVIIAFLGGSVTAGYNPDGMIAENYAELFCGYFSEKYCSEKDTCICINAGFASSTTMHGLAITETKIKDINPDIVFIEYAINNGTDRTYIASFESLVHKLLNLESKPAVIPVIVCNLEFYSCSSYMEMVARYYDLPVVNVYHFIKTSLDHELMQWSDYSNDYGHPTSEGHKLITDCIIGLFEHIAGKVNSHYEIPQNACVNREFSTFELIDHNSLFPVEYGSFEPFATNEIFPDGWLHRKGNTNKPFRFQIKCRSLFLLYEQNSSMDYGEIEVTDEVKSLIMIDGYTICGWSHPDIKLIFNNSEPKQHQIEIRMCEGDENKMFSLLGIGVVR